MTIPDYIVRRTTIQFMPGTCSDFRGGQWSRDKTLKLYMRNLEWKKGNRNFLKYEKVKVTSNITTAAYIAVKKARKKRKCISFYHWIHKIKRDGEQSTEPISGLRN